MYLIIDEVSMVSNQTLMHASKQLLEITALKGVPFGGLSAITVGDNGGLAEKF